MTTTLHRQFKKTAAIGYKNIGDAKDTSGYTEHYGEKLFLASVDQAKYLALIHDEPIPTPQPQYDDYEMESTKLKKAESRPLSRSVIGSKA